MLAEGYTATDILARYKRMKGFNVLHPIAWDAFGLPAEQFALQTGTHPATTTKKNIDRFREQLQSLGASHSSPQAEPPFKSQIDTERSGLKRHPRRQFLKAA